MDFFNNLFTTLEISKLTLFVLLNILVIFALLSLIVSTRIYAIVFLVATYLIVAIIALKVNLDFIAVIILIVYMGAISIFFLFIIMLIGQERSYKDEISSLNILGFIGCSVMFCVICYSIVNGFPSDNSLLFLNTTSNLADELFLTKHVEYVKGGYPISDIEEIGLVLYTWFFIPFIGCAFILLAAIIGSIKLTTLIKKSERKRYDIMEQLLKININYSKIRNQKVTYLNSETKREFSTEEEGTKKKKKKKKKAKEVPKVKQRPRRRRLTWRDYGWWMKVIDDWNRSDEEVYDFEERKYYIITTIYWVLFDAGSYVCLILGLLLDKPMMILYFFIPYPFIGFIGAYVAYHAFKRDDYSYRIVTEECDHEDIDGYGNWKMHNLGFRGFDELTGDEKWYGD